MSLDKVHCSYIVLSVVAECLVLRFLMMSLVN